MRIVIMDRMTEIIYPLTDTGVLTLPTPGEAVIMTLLVEIMAPPAVEILALLGIGLLGENLVMQIIIPMDPLVEILDIPREDAESLVGDLLGLKMRVRLFF